MQYLTLENLQTVLAVAGLAIFWLWESSSPFFAMAGRLRHAARNLAVAGINAVAVVLLFSSLTAAVVAWTGSKGFGLLPQVEAPRWALLLASLILMDLWTYFWHRMNHRVGLLWRFHRLHHSDEQMDVTTAVRFHLGEIAISTGARIVPIMLLGAPPESIILYDVVLLLVAQFHHANIGLRPDFDSTLRYAIVTPNMHRVHHSQERVETDSNYASILSVWDRLFRTYRQRKDYRTIRYGVAGMTGNRFQSLGGLLATPLRDPDPGSRA